MGPQHLAPIPLHHRPTINMPLIEEREEEAHRTAHDPHLPTKGCERQDTPRLYTANPFTKNPVFTTP